MCRSLALRSAPLLPSCALMTSLFFNNQQIATGTQKLMPTQCLLQGKNIQQICAQASRVSWRGSGSGPTLDPSRCNAR